MWDLSVADDHTFHVATGERADDPTALVHNLDACQIAARRIHQQIGGKIKRVGSFHGRAPMGSTHPGGDGRWVYHEFVVKDGLVYDDFVTGVPEAEYIRYFPAWEIDHLTTVMG